jgi:hypothetical protein
MRRSARTDLSPPRPYTGPFATAARVARGRLIVELRDGRTLLVPLQLIPGFTELPRRAVSTCEVVGGGVAIHFPAIDEDVGVENLLRPELTLVPRILPRVVNSRGNHTRHRRAAR